MHISFCYNADTKIFCAGGGIGRRVSLRGWWGLAPWRFKSSPAHTYKKRRNRRFLYVCLYCTKLKPISKTGNVPRAERVVALN